MKHDIPIPSDKELFGPTCKDQIAEQKGHPRVGVGGAVRELLIQYWRRNRSKYPRPLNADERKRKRLKEEEEEEAERRGSTRCIMREKWLRDRTEFDPTKVFPKGSIEEYFQLVEASKRGIHLKEARMLQSWRNCKQ